MNEGIKNDILTGRTALGIEFGSTRIKAVLVDSANAPVASGDFGWENRLENGIWTYGTDEVIKGLQVCFKALKEDVKTKYGTELKTTGSMGISAMMHGYLAFDDNWQLLVPFRTWRNTITGKAAKKLTEVFNFNIPERWSVAHLYHAVLNNEEHIGRLAHITTLAGYVHKLITGENTVGIGEASGMFPIDSSTMYYRADLADKFDSLTNGKIPPVRELLPKVLTAGELGGTLTKEGAALLDPEGVFEAGVRLCPPEGDAGTGMAATNSVRVKSGNISAGTSVFAMVVLEKPLNRVYRQIDMVTTPDGKPVAMVHCNNCTNEINAWAGMFNGFLNAMGYSADMGDIYTAMFTSALKGAADGGGIVLYNYLSGEPVTDVQKGSPMTARTPKAVFSFENLMRVQLYGAVATLKTGMDLLNEEGQCAENIYGHGGFFKTPEAGQQIMADAMGTKISVTETAGEGGPWGMALLAAYMATGQQGEQLEDWLENKVFKGAKTIARMPHEEGRRGFEKFMELYNRGLKAQRLTGEILGE